MSKLYKIYAILKCVKLYIPHVLCYDAMISTYWDCESFRYWGDHYRVCGDTKMNNWGY